ncbi:hypothetical protein ScPMuIL_000306 [Solemya velum]
MAAATGRVDELVKDYLLFRGFTATLRTLDVEIKNDKDKGFRVDRIIEQLQYYINNYELVSLRDYWTYLSHRLFSRLEQRFMSSVRKLEVSLFRHYLVNAAQNNRQDKIVEFFEKMTPDLQNQAEFKEWFSFPFIKNPEENSSFALYFTRSWQDTFYLSLHNFLSPHLLNFEIDYQRMKNLQEENETLKQKKNDSDFKVKNSSTAHSGVNSMELIYDFSGLTEDICVQEKQQKSRRFPINFSASPLLGKKQSNSSSIKPKKVEGTSVFVPKQESAPVSDRHRVKHGKTNVVSAQIRPVKNSNLSVTSTQDTQTSQIHVTAPLVPAPVTKKIIDQKTAYEKQRKELLGSTSPGRPKDKVTKKSEATAPVQASSFTVPHPKPSTDSSSTEPLKPIPRVVEPEKVHVKPDNIPISAPTANVTVSTGKQDPPVKECPFILLSQEEYGEHHSAISYCRFSNTGNYVASVDVDGVVKVWSWSPQPATAATVMSKSPFLSLEWASKTDRWLLLGNRSGNIRLFDVKEMKSFYEAAGDASYPRIVCLCSSPVSTQFVSSATVNRGRSGSFGGDSGVATGSKVGKLTLWDLKTMKLEKQLPIDSGPVAISCCAYNHNAQLLLTGAVDGQIRIFDMQQHKCISSWQAHDGQVICVQFSSDETSCFSMGSDGKFLQWSVHRTGRLLQELPIHDGASLPFLTSSPLGGKELPKGKLFAFDSESQYLLTCDRDKSIVYQMTKTVAGMSAMMEVKGHRSSVTTVDWSPSLDTHAFLTGSMDGKIKISTLLPH